ncbi:hypothetical protein AAFF_G00063210 [Aldrovandia affinis]|uniref:Uncharacterized protein n=1 Tax=Aldrovandia affinis TaxID=143900 RepID=A0AAD7RZJ5_9TELE|nr:hypothetical protein AAFF_G00063210 [Aldrovandia affinis]
MRVQIQSEEEQRRQHAHTMEIQIQNTELLPAELKERNTLSPKGQHHPLTRLCGFQDVDPQASTDSLSEGKSSAAAAMAEEEAGYVTAREDEGTPHSEEGADLGEMFALNPEAEVNPMTGP